MAENGQYKFSIGLDSKQLELDVAQAKKAFDSLVKQAQQAGAKIDNIPNPFENIGKSATQVAQATQQFNGLNMATQQLVRELPAASMGLNTFFLAVSNNLPVFADQVKNLRQQGTSAAGVLKGIGSALFSWQTALVLGVTALSMYGKEIGNWISSLFKGKNAVDSVKEATESLNASIEKNGLGIGKELGKYESLRREFESINGDLKEQERFVRDNQSAFDDLGVSVNSVVDAEAFFSGQGTEAFLTALRLRAEALAAQKLAVEQYEKAIIAETEASKLPEKIITSTTPIYARTRTGVVTTGYKVNTSDNPERKELEAEAKSARSVADAYFDMYDAKMKAAGDTLEDANIKQNDQQTQAELRTAELRAKQIANTSARLVADATKARTQAEVDAMAEGFKKKIAQINLDYDLEEQAITKREEELRKLRGGMLTKQEEDAIAAMRSANKANRDRDINAANASESARIAAETKKSQEAWNEYLILYGTFKEKQKAITDKYNAEIADAETAGERKALEAERDAILAEFAVEAEGFGKELVDKTTVELNKMLADLEAQAEQAQATFEAMESSETNDARQTRETINELNAKIKYLQSLLDKAGKSVSDDNWAEATQVFQSIASSAREAADDIAGLDENLAYMLRSLADLAGAATNITASIQALEKAVEAVEKASAVLAIIGAVIQAISYIANIFNENAEATQRATDALRAYNAELERINNENISNAYSNIFGKDEFGEFNARLKAVREYQTEIDKIYAEADRDKYFGRYKGFEPDDMTLSADMRSGWQKFWGTGDENVKKTSLNEFFNNGVLDVEKLKAYYDAYGEYLDESEKELVEKLISNGELLQENIDAVTNYLQGKFGNLGGDITNALLDSFKNGTDAAEAFAEATGKILDRLASDIVNMALIQPIMDNAQKEVLELQNKLNAGKISYEEYLKQTSAILNNTINEAKGATEDAYDMYKAAGIEQNGSSSSSATSKGFQTMSQETGSELNGRFTDIQGQTHRIAEAVEFNKSMQQQQTLYLQSVSETLAAIHTNTDSIERHTRALANIESDISAMRRTMDNGGGI